MIFKSMLLMILVNSKLTGRGLTLVQIRKLALNLSSTRYVIK